MQRQCSAQQVSCYNTHTHMRRHPHAHMHAHTPTSFRWRARAMHVLPTSQVVPVSNYQKGCNAQLLKPSSASSSGIPPLTLGSSLHEFPKATLTRLKVYAQPPSLKQKHIEGGSSWPPQRQGGSHQTMAASTKVCLLERSPLHWGLAASRVSQSL